MRQVRRMTFETNSSSTHSLTMCSQETFDKWCNGEILYCDWKEDFIEAKKLTDADYKQAGEQYESSKGKYYKSWDELSDEERKEYTTQFVRSIRMMNSSYDDYLTRSEWLDRHSCSTETFTQHYTSESGDNIVAFGYYGYDG